MSSNKEPIDLEDATDEKYPIASVLMGVARSAPRFVAKQRAIVYASEVGEAGRPIMKPWMVTWAYAFSFLYVGVDTGLKAQEAFDKTGSKTDAVKTAGYMLGFHGLASMYLPMVAVHTTVKYSKKGIDWSGLFKKMPRVRGWAPTVLGLFAIPWIVHPIDHGVEWVMERTVKPILFSE